MNDNAVLRVIAAVIIPFAVVYGSYVTIYGHLSPGGGFPGGTLLATAAILHALTGTSGSNARRGGAGARRGNASEWMESGALLAYIALGLAGIAGGQLFLTNLAAGFPRGTFGTVLSAGFIPLIGVAISVKVASTMIRLFRAMAEDEPAPADPVADREARK